MSVGDRTDGVTGPSGPRSCGTTPWPRRALSGVTDLGRSRGAARAGPSSAGDLARPGPAGSGVSAAGDVPDRLGVSDGPLRHGTAGGEV